MLGNLWPQSIHCLGSLLENGISLDNRRAQTHCSIGAVQRNGTVFTLFPHARIPQQYAWMRTFRSRFIVRHIIEGRS